MTTRERIRALDIPLTTEERVYTIEEVAKLIDARLDEVDSLIRSLPEMVGEIIDARRSAQRKKIYSFLKKYIPATGVGKLIFDFTLALLGIILG